MSKRSYLTSLVLVGAISFGLLPGNSEQADATTGIRYTLKITINDLYQEEGSFRPPVKINASDAKILMARTCKGYLGAKPEIRTFLASGKQLNPTPLRPGYKFKAGEWVKDANGENLFRLTGMCEYVATITQRLPDSNFYSFSANAGIGGSLRADRGYSYTKQQLLKMKNGITEIRTGSLVSFSPIPEIETPIVSILECGQGIMSTGEDFSEESEEPIGEKIDVAYIGITNGVYRKVPYPGTFYPLVEMTGGNQMYGDTWRVEYESPQSVEITQASELIPIFATWKKGTDAAYKFDVRVTYFKEAETGKTVAKEKGFEITLGSSCKNAKVIAR